MAVTGLASGAVITGYSYPMVAKYINTAGTISHSDGMDLARGVSVSVSIETLGEDNTFYANNGAAEVAPQRFKSGTATLTVDGLLPAAREATVGTDTVEWTDYGDDQKIPYVTVGYVIRRQSAGVEFFQAVVFNKCRFAQFEPSAETQGEDIDWQTTELEAKLLRDDSSKHNWKAISEPLATELEAYNAVRVALGLSVATALPGNGAITA